MNRHSILVALMAIAVTGFSYGSDWPRFRGPNGSGISDSPVPTEFGADKNLKWKVELPGKGVSSPIVVGDKVFVTCYSGYGVAGGRDAGNIEDLKRHLVCVDRATGDVIWDKTVEVVLPEDPYSGPGVPAHGYASHTPVSDGERIYAFFGKSGVVAFDMEGNQLWQTNVGQESGQMRWGSAASPIVYKDTVIVNASDEAEALIGLDAKTGEEKWSAKAGGLADTWGTPALAETDNGAEVVLSVPGEIWGFNAETGKLRWYAKGNPGASHSVVIEDGIVYSIGGGRGGANGVAVKVGGKGEVTDLVWENRASGRFASPLVYEGRVYAVNGDRVACFDAKTGEEIYAERFPADPAAGSAEGGRPEGGRPEGGRPPRGEGGGRPGGGGPPGAPGGGRPGGGPPPAPGGGQEGGRGGFGGGFGGGRGGGGGFGNQSYASPVIAGDRIYVTMATGTVYVLETGPDFKMVATNDLSFDKSGFNGTPAVSDGNLFLRSHTHLYCIGE